MRNCPCSQFTEEKELSLGMELKEKESAQQHRWRGGGVVDGLAPRWGRTPPRQTGRHDASIGSHCGILMSEEQAQLSIFYVDM